MKWHPPRRVAAVGEGEVANAQLVHGAKCAQAAVNGVSSFDANQTGRLILSKGRHDVCRVGALRSKYDTLHLPHTFV